MNLIHMAREIHRLAAQKGWWPEGEEKDIREIFALIHGEWSEALEAHRDGWPMVGRMCMEGDGPHHICRYDAVDCLCANEQSCPVRGHKPEGIAVELIDGCIRLLDYVGSMKGMGDRTQWCFENMPIEAEEMSMKRFGIDGKMPLPVLVCELHEHTVNALVFEGARADAIFAIIAIVFGWIRAQGVSPWAVMEEKHEYNRGREWRHGGKLC